MSLTRSNILCWVLLYLRLIPRDQDSNKDKNICLGHWVLNKKRLEATRRRGAQPITVHPVYLRGRCTAAEVVDRHKLAAADSEVSSSQMLLHWDYRTLLLENILRLSDLRFSTSIMRRYSIVGLVVIFTCVLQGARCFKAPRFPFKITVTSW